MLRDKLMFTPEPRNGQYGWRFTGEATTSELLTGVIPELGQSSQALAYLMPASWNQIASWLQQLDGLRRRRERLPGMLEPVQ